jgi:cobalamin biosynthesis protein CobT
MFLKNLSLFLEAEDDNNNDNTPAEQGSEEQTTKYSIEDSEFDNDESTNNDESNDNNTGTESGQEGGEDENVDETETMDGEQSPEDTGEVSNDTNPDDNLNNNSHYKKYILLKEYKSLLTNIINIDKSLDYLKKENNHKIEVLDFVLTLIEKVEGLKIKINFYLTNNFINNSYEDSLTNFLYFKKEFESILTVIEKLIDDLNKSN